MENITLILAIITITINIFTITLLIKLNKKLNWKDSS